MNRFRGRSAYFPHLAKNGRDMGHPGPLVRKYPGNSILSHRLSRYARHPPNEVISRASVSAYGSQIKPFTMRPSSKVMLPIPSGGGTSAVNDPKLHTGMSHNSTATEDPFSVAG